MSSMMMFEERHNVIGSKLSLMRLNSKWLMPNTIYPNWHKSLELIFVESGRLSLRIEREEYLLEKGEIAVINMGKVHYGNPPAGEQCILWVFLIELDEQMIWNHELEGKYLWPLIRKEIEIIPVLRQETEGCRRVKKCLEQMYTMLETKEEEPVFKRRIRTDNPICELKAISLLYELMYQIFDTEGLLITVSEGGKNTSVQRKNDICTILQYIEEHYTQKIYVEQLADLNTYGINYGVTTLIETPEGGKQAPSNTQCFMVTSSASDEEALAAERFISWWHTGNDDEAIEDTAVYAWSDRIGYPTYYIPVADSEGYQNNANMKAITVTDPEYCMDSVAPGNFRAWAPILSGPLTQFFNTMTFDGDTSTVLEDCQKEAERIINEEYGY